MAPAWTGMPGTARFWPVTDVGPATPGSNTSTCPGPDQTGIEQPAAPHDSRSPLGRPGRGSSGRQDLEVAFGPAHPPPTGGALTCAMQEVIVPVRPQAPVAPCEAFWLRVRPDHGRRPPSNLAETRFGSRVRTHQ